MNDALGRLLGRTNRPDPARADKANEIADVVRRALDLSEQETVTVQELTCTEPGCPPIETKIGVLGARQRRWTLHRPLSEVDDEAIEQALTAQPEGETHE